MNLISKFTGINSGYLKSVLLARRLGKNFKTFIDIGANVGDYSKAFRRVFRDAEIYCFEPNPKALKKLRQTDEGFNIYGYALSDKNENIEFHFDKEWDSTSSLLEYDVDNKRFGKSTEKIEAVSKRFDSLDIKIIPPCFVKIDVLGADTKVLKGFGEKLKEVDVLNIEFIFNREYKGQSKMSELFKLIEEARFTHFKQVMGKIDKRCELFFYRKI